MGGDVIAIIIVCVLAFVITFAGGLFKARFSDAKVDPL